MMTLMNPKPHDCLDRLTPVCSFLVASGVTAVKTDTQSLLDYPQNADDRRNLATSYQDAWRAAMMKHFRGKAIACMAQIPQIVFRTMMRADMPKTLMRNSDDFFPDEPRSVTLSSSTLTRH